MILRVEHTTEFRYDGPIAEAYTELRLRPLEGGGQHCSAFRLTTEPHAMRVREYRDHFGNDVHHFDVLESHDRLEVTAVSEVWTPQALVNDRHVPTPIERYDYLHPTEYAPFSDSVRELAARARHRRAARADARRQRAARLRAGRHRRADARRRGARSSAAASARTSPT